MALGRNSSTPGRVIQTSPSIFTFSGTMPLLFYTDMPPKVSQYYSIPSLGLLSRRMQPSSAAIQLMPLPNSCEKKWETLDEKECLSSFRMNCSKVFLHSSFHHLDVFPKEKEAREWSMIIHSQESILKLWNEHHQKPYNGVEPCIASYGMFSQPMNCMDQFYCPRLIYPMASISCTSLQAVHWNLPFHFLKLLMILLSL